MGPYHDRDALGGSSWIEPVLGNAGVSRYDGDVTAGCVSTAFIDLSHYQVNCAVFVERIERRAVPLYSSNLVRKPG